MTINVLIFGQLTDIVNRPKLELPLVDNTTKLVEQMNRLYPVLSNSSYRIAVNKKLITENTPLNAGDTVAFLPPFSGG